MNKTIFIIASILLLAGCKQNIADNYYVEGVSEPIISLNGTWKISTNHPIEFWKLNNLTDEWQNIEVPGECMMQNIPIKHDEPFVYKKTIDIPTDYKNKTILLQFDGVYSYARVWVNGKYVRDHSGGFTRWTCDITPFVVSGNSAVITVEVTDKADEISYGSGYAKHQIGGILRDVSLMALPDNYPEEVIIKTDFDDHFQDAVLSISGKTKKPSGNTKLNVALYNNKNKTIELNINSVSFNNNQEFQIKNNIVKPLKWDAEHPNLYCLKVSFVENDKLIWQKRYKFGFREVAVQGNKLLVNGKEVKLRGANRHDVHPLLGRVSTPEYELKDVLLTKEANMNFIRTSHYPPTENFLSLCDEYGIYVEDETAVCFAGSNRTEEYFSGFSESDTTFTKRYLSQLREMVTNHINHPSVIIWSIGNENSFGVNFKKSYDWVKKYDDTRPVIFSYPGNVPDSISSYDILSMHYPNVSGNKEQYGKETICFGYDKMPVIFDEWAHVACYNNFTVMEDPNIRDFWGISLDRMWSKTFEADGGLGGAIWCMIDETFMLPESLPGFNEWWGKINKNTNPATYSGNTVGYGEWGIVDVWRRKKPEFWNTKKAYSPVKLLQTQFEQLPENKPIIVPVYNRFDHANINELDITIEYKGKTTTVDPPSIVPHSKGELLLPIKEWDVEEPILLGFYNKKKQLIDKYQITQTVKNKHANIKKTTKSIDIEETETDIAIVCENETKIVFDKNTGMIKEFQKPSGSISVLGPVINLRAKGKAIKKSYHSINDYDNNWLLDGFNYEKVDDFVNINIKGSYDNTISAEFKIKVMPDGEMGIKYKVDGVPQKDIREIGIKFSFDDIIDSISWRRKPYWSYYPDNHLSAEIGTVSLYPDKLNIYRKKPDKDWNKDAKSFYYNGVKNETSRTQLTNISKSTKENILSYCLMIDMQPFLSVIGNGDVSCRIAKRKNTIQLFANNETDYINIGWGNFQRNIKLNTNYSNHIVVKINTDSNNLYK